MLTWIRESITTRLRAHDHVLLMLSGSGSMRRIIIMFALELTRVGKISHIREMRPDDCSQPDSTCTRSSTATISASQADKAKQNCKLVKASDDGLEKFAVTRLALSLARLGQAVAHICLIGRDSMRRAILVRDVLQAQSIVSWSEIRQHTQRLCPIG